MSRYFFALWPDNSIRSVITNCSAQLPITDSKTVSSNLHITLLFMGKLNKYQLTTLINQVQQIVCPKFEINLNHRGYFINSKAIWLGLESTPDILMQLHQQLLQTAKQCNIMIKAQTYKPHLTLSRKASPADRQAIVPIHWLVKRFVLIESIDTAKRVVYQPIKFFSCD
jgi:RNA 2',3'-cyclic 3'-phosphodiesterase